MLDFIVEFLRAGFVSLLRQCSYESLRLFRYCIQETLTFVDKSEVVTYQIIFPFLFVYIRHDDQ